MLNRPDEDDVVWMSVPLSSDTAKRLLHLSNECDAAPNKVAASLLHDVLEEDAVAHGYAPEGVTIN